MNKYTLYQAFDKGHYINQHAFCKVSNYICGNLISWSSNRSFWEAAYNTVTKLMVACNWKQKRGLTLMAKKEDTIYNDELVNFLEDEKHKRYICSIV